MADDDKPEGEHSVHEFPPQYGQDDIAAQKRLAMQMMTQMPRNTQEQRAVIRFMNELIEWQERPNGNGDERASGAP